MEITAEGVQARLGGADILRGVDLRAGAGDFVGVIGPNGSGKSTLLKCIYRVLQPSAGAVYLDGRSLEACSFRVWRYWRSTIFIILILQYKMWC